MLATSNLEGLYSKDSVQVAETSTEINSIKVGPAESKLGELNYLAI